MKHDTLQVQHECLLFVSEWCAIHLRGSLSLRCLRKLNWWYNRPILQRDLSNMFDIHILICGNHNTNANCFFWQVHVHNNVISRLHLFVVARSLMTSSTHYGFAPHETRRSNMQISFQKNVQGTRNKMHNCQSFKSRVYINVITIVSALSVRIIDLFIEEQCP